ncbi:cyclophilin type peptidyl-prolyl cis-trans isomerase/CLD domain-containing protein [Phthorimaea operculella]|nr:cyclophilin type peptidyl-prolyl cis-trans isomerase/CLD domain-containing protein [Phthorimaea operculella]
MALFNLPVQSTKPPKPASVHPWQHTIKDQYSPYIKLSHNSVNNPQYPKPVNNPQYPKSKQKKDGAKLINFTVVGNRVTKEFIYCVNLVKGMHKYKSKRFGPPVIRAVTGVEWQSNTLRDLQCQYGQPAHCLRSQVAVIANGEFIGGENDLRDMIESKYYINLLALNYQKESIKAFARYLKEIGRPVAYMHITINGKSIGSLMFMLYSDIVPRTCENFLRLCTTKKGGYAGTPVHRIVKDGWIQCGGFGLKNTEMDCENFIVNFDRRGVLGMANAGRHLDCSTQFFVLLQPNVCFKLRFVAFGQLIDGAETLKKIEEVKTYYEAPLDEVMIVTAGIVNLDGRDIHINKDAREYIEKHIDDLVVIGEMFYEMLLDNVFLEAEFRRLQRLEDGMGEEGLDEDAFGQYVDDKGNYIPENIRATRRFIRKKSELQKANAERHEREKTPLKAIKKPDDTDALKSTRKTEGGENNEFDVEDYEPEEYAYSKVSGPSTIKKETRPYYLALTDVPYPEEKSSSFDLKRFLQGDYCLEADLNEKDTAVNTAHNQWKRDHKMNAVSQIISSYGGVKWGIDSESDTEESTSSGTLDSDEEQEIKDYLQQYGEKVSFSGNVVKAISKKHVSENPMKYKKPCEFWNDEELRRMRLAVKEVESRTMKKVSLNVNPWETHTEIKRRQTGYVPSTKLEDSDDEDVEIKRDNTGSQRRKISVRIAPKELNRTSILPSQTMEASYSDKVRPSVLMRLYDDIAIDERNPSPTLKDFKPSMTTPHKKTFTLAEDLGENLYLRRSMNVFQKQLNQDKSSFEAMPSGRRSVADTRRTVSLDYSSRPWAEVLSINSVDYNRKRPSISVSQYQQKNKIEMEALVKKLNKEEARKHRKEEANKKQTEPDIPTRIPTLEGRRGIRLPGDTPVESDR